MNIEIYEEVLFTYLFLRLPIIFCLSLAALGMEWMRSHLYQGRFYKPFLLNIFLAWIPLILSAIAYVVFLENNFHQTWVTLFLLAIWFVFFPNSIYLITEVHHFRDRFADQAKDPFWFDNIELLSIVGVGLLLGSDSLAIIQFLLRNHFSSGVSWLLVIGYVFLANVGIYIGRYMRFNSWDVVARPIQLCQRLSSELKQPGKLKTLIGYATLFSFFILMFYLFIELTLSNLYVLRLEIEKLRQSQ